MRQDIQFATEVLSEAVARSADPEVQFQFAIQARDEIRKLMKAGKPPREHYRYRWIVDTTRKLLGTLSEWGQEFDEAHPQDVSTVLDLLDVVETARLNLIAQCRRMGLEPETAPKAAEKPAEQPLAADVDGEDPGETE